MDSRATAKPPWCWKTVDFLPGFPIQARPPFVLRFCSWDEGLTDSFLHEAKEQISVYEKFHVWELAKKMANPYEVIYTQDDLHFHPSLCILKPLSRSFYKMIEILTVLNFFDRLPKSLQKLRSAHVAEGPGGFIEAFLHLAEKTQRQGKQVVSAHAMTLRPTDSHTPGWRRAMTFLQKHKEVILEYGPDNTGDIYHKCNQDEFVRKCGRGVHFFTADGGFDFSLDYSLQEKKVYHLLVCSVLIGLQVLLPGGALVVKIFDIQSAHTQILCSLVGSCFREWSLYKPATSRPCNSERYLLCRDYRGVNKDVLSMLASIETEVASNRYPVAEIPVAEQAYFARTTAAIVDLQKEALQKAKHYINNPQSWSRAFSESHFFTASEWCSYHSMPFLQKQPNPIAVQAVVSQMSERVAVLRSRSLDVETSRPLPSGQVEPTLYADSDETRAQGSGLSQIDEDNREQIQADAP